MIGNGGGMCQLLVVVGGVVGLKLVTVIIAGEAETAPCGPINERLCNHLTALH